MSDSCASCGVIFASLRPRKPIALPRRQTTAAGYITGFGVASVALPGIAFLISQVLVALIPGCHCDSGAGCHGCGANGLLALMSFGGFVAALLMMFTVLPLSLVVAGIVAVFSKRR